MGSGYGRSAIAKKNLPAQMPNLRSVSGLFLCAILGISTTPSTAQQRFSAIELKPAAVPWENILQLEQLVRKVAADKSTIVVLPEHAVVSPSSDPAIREMSSAQANRRFSMLAKEVRSWILLSVPQRTGKDGKWQTAFLLFNPRSHLALHQVKLSPTSSDGDAAPGNLRDLFTMSIGPIRIGVSSGDDLELTIPRLAELGADTILVSSSWDHKDAISKRRRAIELAKEHQVDLVIAGLGFGTAIVSRKGELLAEASDGYAAQSLQSASNVELPLGLPADSRPRRLQVTSATAKLGQKLFEDPQLSNNGSVSCASCHNPSKLFADESARSVGGLNTRSLLNVDFLPHFGWQGKASTLDEEVLHLFEQDAGMGTSRQTLVETLRRRSDYRVGFHEAFQSDTIAPEQIASALSAYVRTLHAGDSDFDRFWFGGDLNAVKSSAQRGIYLFFGKAGCGSCHAGARGYALFTDYKSHNTGVGDGGGSYFTPMLRNVALTPPYMHDGSIRTLEEVVAFYDRGGNANSGLDPQIRPLHLTAQERADLVEFLKSLTTNTSRQQTASSIDIRSQK